MKINITLPYLVAFLSLFFLINECHDWVHFLVAGLFCRGLGTKGFEGWTFLTGCSPSGGGQVLTWISGPAFNYILMWWGWKQMNHLDPSKQSAGLSLMFATLPLARILAAWNGGGDETMVMRMIFGQQRVAGSHGPAIAGLVMVMVLTGPPLWRAFVILPGWKAKYLAFPAFLYLPILADHAVIRQVLNPLLAERNLSRNLLPGIPALVMGWGLLCLIIYLISHQRLRSLMQAA